VKLTRISAISSNTESLLHSTMISLFLMKIFGATNAVKPSRASES